MRKIVIEQNKSWDPNWDHNLEQFIDADYKQSSGFVAGNRFTKVVRIILLEASVPVVMMQASILELPFSLALVFVRGGPVFLRENQTNKRKNLIFFFAELQNYLKNNYKFFHLNILCNTILTPEHQLMFDESGLRKPYFERFRSFTYIVPLFDVDFNFDALDPKWRNQLRRALSLNPSPEFGSSDALINEYCDLHKQMLEIKLLRNAGVNFSNLMQLRSTVPGFRVLILKHETKPVCGCVFIIFGSKAYYYLAAANYEGRKNYFSNAMIWFLIKKLNKIKLAELDLVGIDPVTNLGGYHFKKGVGGNLKLFMGEWELSSHKFLKFFIDLVLCFRAKAIFKKI